MAASYTVQPGDTLTAIAARVGMNWLDILNLNRDRIRNPDASRLSDGRYNVIVPGMVLRLVGAGVVETQQPSQVWTPSSSTAGGGGGIAPKESSAMLWLAVAAVFVAFVVLSD